MKSVIIIFIRYGVCLKSYCSIDIALQSVRRFETNDGEMASWPLC